MSKHQIGFQVATGNQIPWIPWLVQKTDNELKYNLYRLSNMQKEPQVYIFNKNIKDYIYNKPKWSGLYWFRVSTKTHLKLVSISHFLNTLLDLFSP